MAKRQRAMEFHRSCLLRQGLKALRWNMMIGRELAKMGVWHHQRWKHRRVFLKVISFIIQLMHYSVLVYVGLWKHVNLLFVVCAGWYI